MSDVRSAVAGALAALALLLVLVNIALELTNGGEQAKVNQRQVFINQNAAVMNVDNALIRALATAAVTNKDAQIDDVLKRAGVTYTQTPPPAQTAPAPAKP
jgi:ribosomal protein L12E/L44/L45/RPP1/RPP2